MFVKKDTTDTVSLMLQRDRDLAHSDINEADWGPRSCNEAFASDDSSGELLGEGSTGPTRIKLLLLDVV